MPPQPLRRPQKGRKKERARLTLGGVVGSWDGWCAPPESSLTPGRPTWQCIWLQVVHRALRQTGPSLFVFVGGQRLQGSPTTGRVTTEGQVRHTWEQVQAGAAAVTSLSGLGVHGRVRGWMKVSVCVLLHRRALSRQLTATRVICQSQKQNIIPRNGSCSAFRNSKSTPVNPRPWVRRPLGDIIIMGHTWKILLLIHVSHKDV